MEDINKSKEETTTLVHKQSKIDLAWLSQINFPNRIRKIWLRGISLNEKKKVLAPYSFEILGRFCNVESLTLDNMMFHKRRIDFAFSQTLCELNLHNCSIEEIDLNQLPKGIKSIKLSNNRLKDIQRIDLPDLVELELSSNLFENVDFLKTSNLLNLKRLSL